MIKLFHGCLMLQLKCSYKIAIVASTKTKRKKYHLLNLGNKPVPGQKNVL